MVHIPRSVALQALLWCDQLEQEIAVGNRELVLEKMQGLFQSWLDDFKDVDAIVALGAIRAYANEVLKEPEEQDCEGV